MQLLRQEIESVDLYLGSRDREERMNFADGKVRALCG